MTGAWIQQASTMGSAVDNAVTVALILLCLLVATAVASRRMAHLPSRRRDRDPAHKSPGPPAGR